MGTAFYGIALNADIALHRGKVIRSAIVQDAEQQSRRRKRGRVMRYDDMPKGRNKDRCVRCGKRYNFADKALSKAKVPYDLLCLAEVTASGYMTHGNVKLCDECMAELLMWLDADDFCSYGEREGE